jgi:2-polyprenyl-3-methyl-5-hydroxy-6-metoxy-1,4-benzoquinol methylase
VRPFPEYEEYFVPYAIKRSLYSSHYYAARLVGTKQRVLEIGCGDGAFGAELIRAGNRVVGVDRAPHVPPEASYAAIIEADLESGVRDALHKCGEEFDRIVIFDVLEHLRDPNRLLRELRTQLASRGKLIISVPNAVNVTVRLMVLFGKFSYSNRGILDWSHLRFFTRRTIRKLLEQNGYRVTRRYYTIIPIERVIPVRPENHLLRFANRLLGIATRLAPGLLAYEIVVIAER